MAEAVASRELQVFRYEKPDQDPAGKVSVRLCRSDILSLGVQVVMKEGGETNLHSHTGQDEAWIVLSGRVKFYDKDKLVGDLGKYEGIFIPKGAPYWFEASEEPLEIIRVSAKDKDIKDERVNYTEPTDRYLASRSRGETGRSPGPGEG